MKLHPILTALRRHKSGVVLIALQIALTLAIVCNAIFIIGQRIERIGRPTGMDENGLFLVSQQWVNAPDSDDPAGVARLDAMQLEDLAALRRLPDVASVAALSSLPLLGSGGSNGSVNFEPEQKKAFLNTAFYYGDENVLSTLGLRLVAGRAFNPGDVAHLGYRSNDLPAAVIVTKALGDALFPRGDAVGKSVYFDGGSKPSTIVGVVARLQVSSSDSWQNSFARNSVLAPIRLDGYYARYVLRAKPGRLEAAMKAVPSALYAVTPMRVLDDDSVRSYADIRAEAYRSDLGMAILMSVVCLILLAVTAAGIVGLSSFWVGQRHRQIGVRRALGARKVDILHYFQAENLLIAGFGAAIGIVLAVALNLWLISHYEMDRMPVIYVLAGVTAVLALGQIAVFAPARRASNVPPVVATRSV